MYRTEELLEELRKLTPVEEAALATGETDDIKVGEYLGMTDYVYDKNHVRRMSGKYYFRAETGITYAKHPRFVTCALHSHDFFEIAYAYQGDFFQTVQKTKLKVEEGSLLLLDPNVKHSLDMVDKDTFIINILLSKEYFQEKLMQQFSNSNLITEFIFSALYKNSLNGNYLLFSLGNNAEIRAYITAILLELKHGKPGSDEIVNSFMTILFSTLAREKNCLNAFSSSASKAAPSSIVSILDYIGKNYMTLSLEEAAGHFHFSPNYLSRLLKRYTGKTFITIILEFKLEKAAALLKNTAFPITRVAAASGFQNMNYFYKLFRQTYHCTPKEFRVSSDANRKGTSAPAG